jgi:hypothetical protein
MWATPFDRRNQTSFARGKRRNANTIHLHDETHSPSCLQPWERTTGGPGLVTRAGAFFAGRPLKDACDEDVHLEGATMNATR